MTILYVDVSHHDWNRRGGNLDWSAVRAATSEAMCARATYGDPFGFSPDTFHFADFQSGAAAAGFTLRGGYHNLVRGDTASMRRQVDWFRSELDAYNCHWAMLDIERYKELVERDLWPRFDDVQRFRDAWHQVESRPLAYYLPQWLYNGYYGGDLHELPGALVQSHYLTGIYGSPSQIYNAGGGDSGTGWDDCYGNRCPNIWQYSATCDVLGASSQTDINAFRGSLDELTALLTGDDMTPEQNRKLTVLDCMYTALATDSDTFDNVPTLDGGFITQDFALAKRVKELAARPPVQLSDEQLAKMVDMVVARLGPAVDGLRSGVDADTRDTVLDALRGAAAAVQTD